MIHRFLLHPFDQPLFSVELRTAGCGVELSINDACVFRESSGASMHLTMPINEWLFQGGNEIQLKCMDLAAGAGEATATLEYRRLRQPRKSAIRVASLESESHRSARAENRPLSPAWEPDAKSDMPLALAGEPMEFSLRRRPVRWSGDTLTLAAKFSLPAPWARCPWTDAAVLTEQPNLKYSVGLAQEFWEILSRRDLAALKRLSALRAEALESAYHLNEREVEEALWFPRLLQVSDWRMAAFPHGELQLETAGSGRLARVLDPDTGESPLRLINETAGVEATIDGWWAFTNKWVLMR